MPRVNIPGVGQVNFPDSMSHDQVLSESQRIYAEAQRGGGAPSDVSASGRVPEGPNQNRSFVEGGLNTLPMIGAGVGALVGGGTTGGMAAVPGATIGGGIGESARMAARAALGFPGPQSFGEGVGDIAKSAVGGGLSEIVGIPIRGAMTHLGDRALRESLRIPAGAVKAASNVGGDRAIGQEALQKLVDIQKEYRLPVGKMLWDKQAGSRTANAMREASSAKAEAMIAAATKGGGTATVADLHPYIQDLVDSMSPLKSGSGKADQREVKRLWMAFVKDRSTRPMKQTIRTALLDARGLPIPPSTVAAARKYTEIPLSDFQNIKQDLQKFAEGYYKTSATKGYVVQADRGNSERMYQAAARGAKETLEQKVPDVGGKSLKGQNLETQKLMTITDAIANSELANRSDIGDLWLAVMRRTALNPALQSRLGLTLTHPGMQTGAALTPRALALLAAMSNMPESNP